MRQYFGIALVAVLALQGAPAVAGVFTDDLSKCLVSKSTDADKLMLARWIFSAISANNAIKDLTTVTPEQREASHKKAAALLDKLLTSDCRAEAVQAAKYEGAEAVGTSFGTLGEVAMKSLLNNSAVNHEMESAEKYFDLSKWKAIFEEAGVPTKSPPGK